MVRWQPRIPRVRRRRLARRILILLALNELRGLIVAAPGFAALFGWR